MPHIPLVHHIYPYKPHIPLYATYTPICHIYPSHAKNRTKKKRGMILRMSLEQFLLLLNPGFVELEDAALGNPFVPAAENKMYLGSLSNSLREHEAPQS